MNWLKLTRFPNVFTMVADVLMVALLFSLPWEWMFLAGLGSVALYMAGMVLNDVHDYAEDCQWRPERPLPSGKITLSAARVGGYGLLLGGWCGFLAASLLAGVWYPVLTATLLAGCILAYNSSWKSTPVGPVLMGLCRGLNLVALMSFAPESLDFSAPFWRIPAGITCYILGLTWFARAETEGEDRPAALWLVGSVLVMAGGLGLFYPYVSELTAWNPAWVIPLLLAEPWRWSILVMFLMVFLTFRCTMAIFDSPQRVQRMVKQVIFTIFLLDAGIVLVSCGLPASLLVLVMLLPASVMGKWIASS